jgi:ankyrin repeat protein
LTREKSPVSQFELAADAIVAGDAATLGSLLRENPNLIRARSTRVHRATLLHYLGANGFENYRQKSPGNAVAIAKMLLDAGAEVDAVADTYGKSTTLGLVATSIHPKHAGVQIALMEILLDYGAAIDGVPGGWSLLVSALHNGRGEAAKFLAGRGARLDLEGAAGVGRLDVVECFFSDDGSLKASATRAQMNAGFLWACEYGRTNVVDFLVKRGVDLRAVENTGLTGLHWAVVGGQIDTIQLLLERGAPLEAKNVYGGTALGQALWSAINGDSGVDYVPIIETLLDAGAEIPHGSLSWLAEQKGGSSAAKARIAEVLRRRGTKT